jgi:hypothetical protein
MMLNKTAAEMEQSQCLESIGAASQLIMVVQVFKKLYMILRF